MEHAIGKRITLEVVESDKGCEGCYFDRTIICTIWNCEKANRTDHKNIIYKEIKENESTGM